MKYLLICADQNKNLQIEIDTQRETLIKKLDGALNSGNVVRFHGEDYYVDEPLEGSK